jgi:hypothetical protein
MNKDIATSFKSNPSKRRYRRRMFIYRRRMLKLDKTGCSGNCKSIVWQATYVESN